MPLETASYISQLNTANPLGSDPIAAGDDHIRLLKTTLKNTFPNVTGPVTVTQADLNSIPDLVASVGGISGRIVQAVMSQNGTYSATSASTFTPTGHTAAITPTSTSSKILILTSGYLWQTNQGSGANAYATMYRGTTNLGASYGGFVMQNANSSGGNVSIYGSVAFNYLDSPATTSPITYQVYIKADGGGNAAWNGNGTGTIILLEIK